MKINLTLQVPIEINISDPAAALELFSSQRLDNPFRATPFATLQAYAEVAAVAALDDKLNQSYTAAIDAPYGKITAAVGGAEIISTEIRNADGDIIKSYMGQTYRRVEGGPDCSCADCEANYGRDACIALCSGEPFECPSHVYWVEDTADHLYAPGCEQCRECASYGTCTAQLANSGKTTMPCPAVALAREEAQRALGEVKVCGDCGKLERWQTGPSGLCDACFDKRYPRKEGR